MWPTQKEPYTCVWTYFDIDPEFVALKYCTEFGFDCLILGYFTIWNEKKNGLNNEIPCKGTHPLVKNKDESN